MLQLLPLGHRRLFWILYTVRCCSDPGEEPGSTLTFLDSHFLHLSIQSNRIPKIWLQMSDFIISVNVTSLLYNVQKSLF